MSHTVLKLKRLPPGLFSALVCCAKVFGLKGGSLLRALATLDEELGLNPSTNTWVTTIHNSSSRGSVTSLGTRHTCDIHIYMWGKHTHIKQI